MPKFIDELKTASIKEVLAFLVSALAAVLVTIWLAIQDPLAYILISKVPKSIVVLLPLILLLLLILAVSYIFYLRKKLKEKLFPACGVYWDKNFDPHCPSCQKLLGNYAFYKTGQIGGNSPGFTCISCNKVIRLSDDEKIFMGIKEAREKAKLLYGGNK